MCLLVVWYQAHPDAPLIVAANRDEWLARPASSMVVLRDSRPRIIGGRDLAAGGTWLATNEHGVVVGLTNRPRTLGHDTTRRSRGEIPVALAAHANAADASRAASELRPADYNGCWLLVGDRASLWYVDLTPAAGERARVVALGPGIHVLENVALDEPSEKATRARAAAGAMTSATGGGLPPRIFEMLRSHEMPNGPISARCVHGGPYGTRSSQVTIVPPAASRRPTVYVADGPPCVAPFRDATSIWFE